MKGIPLETNNPNVRLVEPDINRDPELSMGWLAGTRGRDTLRMMGVSDRENKEPTLEQESDRIQGFISNRNQINWMIQLGDRVVGSIWVDLKVNETVPAPAVHIMIGDLAARRKGVGEASLRAVLAYLSQVGYNTIYSRHLVENAASSSLLSKLGFHDDGTLYVDNDGLNWQNVSLKIA